MVKKHSDQRINYLNEYDGFNRFVGIKIEDWRDGEASLRVKITTNHLNPLGIVHGGLFMTMLDVVLAMSGSHTPPPEDLLPGLTLSLTTQYLAPLHLNDDYAVARSRRTAGGKTVFFAEGEVRSPNGRLIATGSGVFKPGQKMKN